MKVIVFTTLFLGLVNGPQMVEMAPRAGVAAVEVRLDGESVAHLHAPPWRTRVELGDELRPHRLAAVAYGPDGRELGRAEQWINLPRPRAEAAILVERRPDGDFARLAWRALEHAEPESVRLLLDGEPLPVDDPAAVPLPPHDPDALHVLSAEITFPDGSTARADAAIGGRYGEETAAELTAVPVRVDGERRLRDAGDAGAWIVAEGEPRPVVAVDHGAASIYAILDAGAHPHLLDLGVSMARRLGAQREAVDAALEEGEEDAPYRLVLHPGAHGPLRAVGLREGDRLHLVRPVVERTPAGYLLFGLSRALGAERAGGSAWLLTHLRLRDANGGSGQRLADAVATSGLQAAASGRPRAVLLVLGPDAEDRSRFTPSEVRAYLRRLGVPLVVAYAEQFEVTLPRERWTSREQVEAEREARRRRLAAARERWGENVVDVDGLRRWIALHRDLRRSVAHQRVLWIEGIHPPGAVALDGAPGWLHRAGEEIER